MFKFDLIDLQKQGGKNSLPDFLKTKLKFLLGNEIPMGHRDKAIFVMSEGKKRGIVGGACLLRKEIKDIHGDIRELISTFFLPQGCVWECSVVRLEMFSGYSDLSTRKSQYMSQIFYRELYEGLVEFGKKKSVGFIIMKLEADIYVSTKEFGLWPYVVELKPEKSIDKLFHGILPLTGSQYEAYQNTWKALDASNQIPLT